MNFGLVLVGLALLVFPGVVGRWAQRLPAAEWTRVGIGSLGLGALCVYAGLVMTTLPPVLHTLQLEGAFGICDPVVHSLMIGGPLVGWAAALSAATLSVAALRAVWRSRRGATVAHIEPWLGHHTARDGYELVVVPTPALIAVGVPGPTPQVVVSQGLVDELDAPRLEAVVAHEVAHLRLRHRRFVMLVNVIDRTLGFIPPVGRSAAAICQSIEEWADDHAVRSAQTAEQSLHAALLTVAGATHSFERAQFAGRPTDPGPSPDRPDALPLGGRPRTGVPAGGRAAVRSRRAGGGLDVELAPHAESRRLLLGRVR